MTYDAARGELVLIGAVYTAGANTSGGPPAAGSASSETWKWRAGRWTKLAPASSPPARTSAGMAYDEVRRQVVLFGGQEATEKIAGRGLHGLQDTWTWDGRSWIEQHPANQPPAAVGPLIVFEAKLGQIVGVIDSELGSPTTQTWTWNGSNWRAVHPAVEPPGPRMNQAMAYDSARGTLVLFGREVCTAPYQCIWDLDTWTFDDSRWSRHPATAGGPSGRDQAAMGYDATTSSIVLFGGRQMYTFLGDTWTWDGTGWNRSSGGESPSPRAYPLAAYDAAEREMVLYGGEWNTQATGMTYYDTWGWANGSWKQLQPSTFPAPAAERAAILKVASTGPGLRGLCTTASPPCMTLEGEPEFGLGAAYVVFTLNPPDGQNGQCESYVSRPGATQAWRLVGVYCGPRAGPMPRLHGTAVVGVSGCANVRSYPGNGPVVACLPNKSSVTLDDGPVVVSGDPTGALWWHIKRLGWVAHQLLLPGGSS